MHNRKSIIPNNLSNAKYILRATVVVLLLINTSMKTPQLLLLFFFLFSFFRINWQRTISHHRKLSLWGSFSSAKLLAVPVFSICFQCCVFIFELLFHCYTCFCLFEYTNSWCALTIRTEKKKKLFLYSFITSLLPFIFRSRFVFSSFFLPYFETVSEAEKMSDIKQNNKFDVEGWFSSFFFYYWFFLISALFSWYNFYSKNRYLNFGTNSLMARLISTLHLLLYTLLDIL